MALPLGEYLDRDGTHRDAHDPLTSRIYFLPYTTGSYHRQIEYRNHCCMDYHGDSAQYHSMDSLHRIYVRKSWGYPLCSLFTRRPPASHFLAPVSLSNLYHLGGIPLDTSRYMDRASRDRGTNRSYHICSCDSREYGVQLLQKEIEKLLFFSFSLRFA